MPILSVKEAQGMKIPPPGPKEYWEDSEWAYEHMNPSRRGGAGKVGP